MYIKHTKLEISKHVTCFYHLDKILCALVFVTPLYLGPNRLRTFQGIPGMAVEEGSRLRRCVDKLYLSSVFSSSLTWAPALECSAKRV